MPLEYNIIRGDTLWGLSHQCLGHGTRYPDIVKYHNDEVAKLGKFRGRPGIFPIKDANLIYAGQTIFMPPRAKYYDTAGSGDPNEGKKPAVNLDMGIKITVPNPQSAPHWIYYLPNAAVTIKLLGTFTLVNKGPYNDKQDLLLTMSPDDVTFKANLKQLHLEAFEKLLVDPEIKLQNGKVVINSPIVANAKAGLVEVEVSYDGPKLVGKLKLLPLKGKIEYDDRKFDYTAEVTFEAEVIPVPVRSLDHKPQKIEVETPINQPKRSPHDKPIKFAEGKTGMSTADKIGIGILTLFFLLIRARVPTSVLQRSPAGLGSPYMMQYDQNGKLII